MLNFYQLHNVLIVKSIASFAERKVCIFSLFSGFLSIFCGFFIANHEEGKKKLLIRYLQIIIQFSVE